MGRSGDRSRGRMTRVGRFMLMAPAIALSVASCVVVPVPLPAGAVGKLGPIPTAAIRARIGSPRSSTTLRYENAGVSAAQVETHAREDCAAADRVLRTLTPAVPDPATPEISSVSYTCRQ